MILPYNNRLPVSSLSRIFANTTATYKFLLVRMFCSLF